MNISEFSLSKTTQNVINSLCERNRKQNKKLRRSKRPFYTESNASKDDREWDCVKRFILAFHFLLHILLSLATTLIIASTQRTSDYTNESFQKKNTISIMKVVTYRCMYSNSHTFHSIQWVLVICRTTNWFTLFFFAMASRIKWKKKLLQIDLDEIFVVNDILNYFVVWYESCALCIPPSILSGSYLENIKLFSIYGHFNSYWICCC